MPSLDQVLFQFSGQDVSLNQILMLPIALLLGYFLLNFLALLVLRSMTKRGTNPDLVQVTRRLLHIAVLLVITLIALQILKVPLTAFAFISGAVAIGVGFGAQNIINNFISGWIVIWERPIRINDFIEVSGVQGSVQEINTRSTRLKRPDGVHLLIPNAKLLEEIVVNWTLVDRLLRCIVRVGVAYGSDVAEVKSLLERLMRAQSDILVEPAPEVVFEDFGDSALIFDAYFWIQLSDVVSARSVRSDLRLAIDAAFRDAGISIAYPQRDVHLAGTLTVTPGRRRLWHKTNRFGDGRALPAGH